MFRNSIVQESGQLWKLVAGLLSLSIGFLIMVYGLRNLRGPDGFTFTFVGMVIGICAFVAMCRAISCPACGMRWLWAAMKTQEQSQWLHWLRAQRVCPRCGHNPMSAKRQSDRGTGVNQPPP